MQAAWKKRTTVNFGTVGDGNFAFEPGTLQWFTILGEDPMNYGDAFAERDGANKSDNSATRDT